MSKFLLSCLSVFFVFAQVAVFGSDEAYLETSGECCEAIAAVAVLPYSMPEITFTGFHPPTAEEPEVWSLSNSVAAVAVTTEEANSCSPGATESDEKMNDGGEGSSKKARHLFLDLPTDVQVICIEFMDQNAITNLYAAGVRYQLGADELE